MPSAEPAANASVPLLQKDYLDRKVPGGSEVPVTSTSKGEYKSPTGAARFLRIVTAAWITALAIGLAYEVSALRVWRAADTEPLAVRIGTIIEIDDRLVTISYVQLMGLLLVTVSLIVFTRRVYRNLLPLGARTLRFKPGWAVGGWFVPFLQAVRPKSILNDAWRGSDPDLPPVYFGPLDSPGVPRVGTVWWVLWIVGPLVVFVADETPATIGEATAVLQQAMVREVAWLVGCLLLIRFATRLALRQDNRARALGFTVPETRWAVASGGLRSRPEILARIAIPVVIALAGYVAGSVSIGATLDEAAAVEPGVQGVLPDSLEVGECADIPDELDVIGLIRVDCADPHDLEAMGSVYHDHAAAAPYPGEFAVFEEAGELCVDKFSVYVARPYEESELDVYIYYPIELGWRAGDRTSLCFAITVDGSKLTGTVKGSGR